MSPRKQELNEKMRTETTAKIINAALKIFAEYGYHGATMKQIAGLTGLSYGLVYHYFSSKEKIFRHLVDFALEGSIATMQTFIDLPGTAWERIEKYSEMVVNDLSSGESSPYFLIMTQAMTQGKSIPNLLNHIYKRTEVYYEMFVPLIVGAQKSGEAIQGDPTALAAAYFSFVQGLALLAFQEKGMEKKITPEMLSNILRN